MATYFVSFTIEDETINGRDYNERWNAMYDAIRSMANSYWEETTSFVAFETEQSIGSITTAVKDALEPAIDTALIRSMDAKDARIIGLVADEDIFKIMPYLKRG